MWVHSDCEVHGGVRYRLSAVVCHLGSQTSKGHYTCISRSGDQWKNINDTKVQKITLKQALDEVSSAYLLFYELDPK